MIISLPRTTALLVAAVAVAALWLQFRVSSALMGLPPAAETLWRMAGYFTILTNLAVAGLMLGLAAGLRCGAGLGAALTLAIVMVGIVYHLVLARLWQPTGLAWWADQGLHSAVPILMLGWWLAFAPKRLAWGDLPVLLAWPAAYAAYALLRGSLTGFWPYPFLDADALGWPEVMWNAAALVAAFAALGAALIGFARRSVG
jgi:hypothetical protein